MADDFLGRYNHGRLPHIDIEGATQFITYRLHDSLPPKVRNKLRYRHPDADSDRRRRSAAAALDRGYGCCWLERPEVADIIVENLDHHDGTRYRLQEWVVMPNHVHVLYTKQAAPLGKIVGGWKSYTSKKILDLAGVTGENRRCWLRGYWDELVESARHFHNVRCYIWLNPVKAGPVDDPLHWEHSSIHRLQEELKPSLRAWYRRWKDRFWEVERWEAPRDDPPEERG